MTEVTAKVVSREINPSARVQLRARGDLMFPASCALCQFDNLEREYVDPAIWFEYEGQIYFCDFCVKEMAALVGCITPEELASFVALQNSLTEENAAVKKELDELRRFKQLTTALFASLGLSVPVVDSGEAAEQPSGDNGPDASTVNGGAEQNAESVKPGEGVGPNDAPRTPSSDSTTARKPVKRASSPL